MSYYIVSYYYHIISYNIISMILFQWKPPPGFPFSPRREALIAMRALGIDVIAMLETPQLIFGEPLELRSPADGVFDSWRNDKYQ